MNEIRVATWDELDAALFRNAYRADLSRTRSSYAFRGLNDSEHALTTSLVRLGGNYSGMEPHLLRAFRKYAHRQAVWRDSVWDWLAVAQHHGLPTRLLDWTFSPHVAMHFATSEMHAEGDSVIWAIDFVRAHRLLPASLRDILDQEGSDIFTVEMLERGTSTLAELESLDEDDFLLFFEPPSLDDRIVNQFALFSLMSRPRSRLDQWLTEHPDLWFKVVIPAVLKWEVRDRLDQANITERVLFPGLDGLSRWLRRYYAPRPGSDAPNKGTSLADP